MNRVWWLDRRPVYLRGAAGWWDYHFPTLAQFLPFRCGECLAWAWRQHRMSCAIGKDLAGREVIFWRTMAIIVGVLAAEVAFIVYVLAPMQPLTLLWWTLFTAAFVFSLTAPFTLSRILRDWWMPRR